jgi:pimeloyl-ACP methyl ester carboxylesterase
MIPTSIIRFWFLGLFSWVLLGIGIYLSHKWYQRAWSYDFNLHRSYFDPHIGNNYETFLLTVAVAELLWVLAGGVIVRGIPSLFTQARGSTDREALHRALVWLSNWMSYLNGSAFLSTKSSGFAGTETWEALHFVTRFQLQASPAVLAQGMFGMLRYDATAMLKAIKVPALVVAGNRDPVCTPEASERMQRDIPGAQMVRLAPAKHMGLIEHHAHFATIVNQFSASCLQPNSPHSAF